MLPAMLIHIGAKPAREGTIGALLECHDRIRAMTALAVRLAEASNASATEIADAARRVHDYFTRGLPLHVRDEEQSLMPRLLGHDTQLDSALHTMQREHDAHTEPLHRLVELCAVLAKAPEQHAQISHELAPVAHSVQQALEEHLAGEEHHVFPAARQLLTAEVLDQVRQEMKARRQ